MKKTKFLSLVLITSALASCETTNHDYEAQYKNYQEPKTDSIPKHWYGYTQSDDMSYQTDSMYYRRDWILNFQVPSSFNIGYPAHPIVIQRGGFGYHTAHMSFSS